MLFNSFEFLIFLPVVVIMYFITKPSYRWVLLLVASYYFYMAWKPMYILLIIASTLIDYFCGFKMSEIADKKKRRPYLYLSLLANLGILFTFKYLDFFGNSLEMGLQAIGISFHHSTFNLILPLGISFYTFQTMSYSIGIYQGQLKAEKHLGIFALFVSFFPQLVAGPIERASSLLPQFHIAHKFDYKRTIDGLRLLLWGMFKKVVVSDRLALLVDAVYNQPTEFEGAALGLATVFFAFQIYCDFSGYSDMAIGMARILGISLMTNFRAPYFSKSISEFWRRWHISLSTWFRDYVYIPLGGNRTVKWRWYYNLLITFIISGLWHGANWTFVIWGALHGIFMVVASMTAPFKKNIRDRLGLDVEGNTVRLWNMSLTFILVCISWVFFRANSMEDAMYIMQSFFDGKLSDLKMIFQYIYSAIPGLPNPPLDKISIASTIMVSSGASLGVNVFNLLMAVLAILFTIVVDYYSLKKKYRIIFFQYPRILRWSFYLIIVYFILFFRAFETSEFIYFQF